MTVEVHGDVFELLLSDLTPEQLGELFESKYVSQAAFRTLAPVTKHLVLQLLPLSDEAQHDRITSWLDASTSAGRSGSSATVRDAIRVLDQLGMLRTTHEADGQARRHLHSKLQESLKSSLVTGTRVPSPNDVASLKAPPLSELEDYAKTQWEALLDFYVDDERNPPPQLPRCLKKMGLAPLSGAQLLAAAGLRTMSRKGATLLEGFDGRFAFLMRPPASQLWQVIRGYVQQLSKAGGADAVASLGLLLEAAYMEPGQPYVLEGRPRAEQQVVAHLCQLGVLLPLESGAQVGFCATHLASVLGGASGSAAAGTQGSVMSGGIVTETNFKVYAYTDSRVQHSILRQFCRPDAVLPNLFVGTITYKSLDEAFNRGLDAETIVNYLEQHAHSKRVASAGGRVPTAVKEQIKLWERAMNRVQAAEVAAFHSFETKEFYSVTWEYARGLGVLRYPLTIPQQAPQDSEDAFKRWPIIVEDGGAEAVKKFILENKPLYVKL